MRNLRVSVTEIRERCPVYEVGDVFYIVDGYKLQATQLICTHSLASIMPYYAALSRGIPPAGLGLGEDKAHVQCLDPCEYTGGGTVVFCIYAEEPRRC